jgi:hypothetical protein
MLKGKAVLSDAELVLVVQEVEMSRRLILVKDFKRISRQ